MQNPNAPDITPELIESILPVMKEFLESIPARVVAFVNGKGGCGKTANCYHVAGELEARGEKVLVIDWDKQRSQSQVLLAWNCYINDVDYDTYVQYTIKNLLVDDIPFEEVAKTSMSVEYRGKMPKESNIDVITSDVDLRKQVIFWGKVINIKEIIYNAVVEHGYTYILLDMPPSNEIINEIVFSQLAQYVVIPFSSDNFSVSGYGDILDEIEEARGTNTELEVIGVFLSKFSGTWSIDSSINQELKELGNVYMEDCAIPFCAEIAKATDQSRAVTKMYPKSRGAKAIRRLTDEIIHRIDEIEKERAS